jgi:hypothetical protein
MLDITINLPGTLHKKSAFQSSEKQDTRCQRARRYVAQILLKHPSSESVTMTAYDGRH